MIHLIDTVLNIPQTISRTLVAAKLTTAAELLAKTGLAKRVNEALDVTVFVPSNAAFKANADTLGKLDAEGVATVLKAHGRPLWSWCPPGGETDLMC